MEFTAEEQREHRLNLARYLLTRVSDEDFTMSIYSHIGATPREVLENDCGTAGCALGHAPLALGILGLEGEDFYQYGRRVLGIGKVPPSLYQNSQAIFPEDEEWCWCFDDEWMDVDNTPQGAGMRILWLENYGLPDNWREQMYGDAKLCYLE